MNLKQIVDNPKYSRTYLDRYVNDGSPSGFTEEYTTSASTNPFSQVPYFNLYACFSPSEYFYDFGKIPNILTPNQYENWIFIHPDMVSHNDLIVSQKIETRKIEEILVSPTSSGRTVQIVENENNDYVKLHYDSILGRVNRRLPLVKTIAGPELSEIIVSGINNQELDIRLGLLPETGGRVLSLPEWGNGNEWGMVWRSGSPYFNAENIDEYKQMIPCFSLFSKDRHNPNDDLILTQIIQLQRLSPFNFMVDNILEPIISCYFSLLLILGLQPEWNAQNLILYFDKNFNKCKIVMRDLKSIDKDISLRESIGLKNSFRSAPFKCISADQYNYYIKHSFMFDFKLGEYVLDPLVRVMTDEFNISEMKIIKTIKDVVDDYILKLPKDFFPKNRTWYKFDEILIDQSKESRPYITCDNAKYRSK